MQLSLFQMTKNPFLRFALFIGIVGTLTGCGGGSGGSSSGKQTGQSSVKVGTTPTPDPTIPVPLTGDYFTSRMPHWSSTPIKVRFDHTTIDSATQANLRLGMDAWKVATGGKISYTVVEDSTADITVDFSGVSPSLHGITQGSWYDDGTLVTMAVHLSTKAKAQSAAIQTRIMAHEWGHAIGLIDNQAPNGHSSNPADRMYPVLDPTAPTNTAILSARDIATIKRVYKL